LKNRSQKRNKPKAPSETFFFVFSFCPPPPAEPPECRRNTGQLPPTPGDHGPWIPMHPETWGAAIGGKPPWLDAREWPPLVAAPARPWPPPLDDGRKSGLNRDPVFFSLFFWFLVLPGDSTASTNTRKTTLGWTLHNPRFRYEDPARNVPRPQLPGYYGEAPPLTTRGLRSL